MLESPGQLVNCFKILDQQEKGPVDHVCELGIPLTSQSVNLSDCVEVRNCVHLTDRGKAVQTVKQFVQGYKELPHRNQEPKFGPLEP